PDGAAGAAEAPAAGGGRGRGGGGERGWEPGRARSDRGTGRGGRRFFMGGEGKGAKPPGGEGWQGRGGVKGRGGAPPGAVPLKRPRRIEAAAGGEAAIAADEGRQERPVRVNRDEQGPAGDAGRRRGRPGGATGLGIHAPPLRANRRPCPAWRPPPGRPPR